VGQDLCQQNDTIMNSPIIFRLLLLTAFTLCFGSYNRSAGYLPVIDLSAYKAPVPQATHAFRSESHMAGIAMVPKMEKGYFFQFLVEEEVHVHEFNFDRLRRRRRFCNLVCFITRLSLMVIHFNIILYHIDHVLHHQLHYLLKSLLAA
jgi:hypothetical protein